MNGHCGIEDKGVERSIYERGGERVFNRDRDDGSCPGLGRDDDFGISPAIEKEGLLKFDAINAVMQTYRQNAPLKFFLEGPRRSSTRLCMGRTGSTPSRFRPDAIATASTSDFDDLPTLVGAAVTLRNWRA